MQILFPRFLSEIDNFYDSLRKVEEHENSRVAMNLTNEFKSTVERLHKQLFDINELTKYLQTKHLSLSDCRLAMDALVEPFTASKDTVGSLMYGCKIREHYIS